MDENVVPTEHVRWRYWSHTPGAMPEFLQATAEHVAGAEFDRWLAAHDRVVAANAWEQGKATGESIQRRRWSDEPNAPEPTNPYRITEENN